MRFGMMVLQHGPISELVDRWRRVEEMGFDDLWMADHLMQTHPSFIHYDGWTLLGAAAVQTRRVRLGLMVSSPTLRHPTVLAHVATTVDHLSEGRLELGLGAGGAPGDNAGIGIYPWPANVLVERMEETIRILDGLLEGSPLSWAGRHYRFDRAVVSASVQRPRPPLTVAAAGVRSIEIAARYADAWNCMGGQPFRTSDALGLDDAVLRATEMMGRFEVACRRWDRDPSTIRKSVLAFKAHPFASVGGFEDLVGRYSEIGFDELVCYWPSSAGEGVMERVAADILAKLR